MSSQRMNNSVGSLSSVSQCFNAFLDRYAEGLLTFILEIIYRRPCFNAL